MSEIDKLKNYIQELYEDNEMYQAEIYDLTAKYQELQKYQTYPGAKTSTDTDKQTQKLKDKIKELEEDMETYQAQIDETTQYCKAAQDELKKLKQNAPPQNTADTAKEKELLRTIYYLKDQNSDLLAKSNEQLQSIQQLKDENAKLRAALNEPAKKTEEKTDNSDLDLMDLTNVKQLVKVLREDLSKVTTERDNAQKQLRLENTAHQQQLDLVKQQSKLSPDQQVADLMQQLKQLKMKYDDLAEQYDQYALKLAAQRVQMLTIQNDQKKTEEAKKEAKRLKEVNEELNDKIRALEISKSELEKEITKLNRTAGQSAEDLASKQKVVDKYAGQIRDFDKKAAEMAQTLREREGQNQLLTTQQLQQQDQIAQMNSQRYKLEYNIEQYKNEMQTLQDQLKTVSKQVSDQAAELKRKSDKYTEDLNGCEQKINQLTIQLSDSKLKESHLGDKTNQYHKEILERDEQVLALNGDLSKSKAALRESEQQCHNLEIQLSAKEKESDERQKIIDKLKQNLQEKDENLNRFSGDYSYLQRYLNECDQKIERLQNELSEKVETIQKYRFQVYSLEDSEKEKDSLIQQLYAATDALQKQLTQTMYDLEYSYQQLKTTGENLAKTKADLTVAQAKDAEYQYQLQQFKSENEALKQQNAEYEFQNTMKSMSNNELDYRLTAAEASQREAGAELKRKELELSEAVNELGAERKKNEQISSDLKELYEKHAKTCISLEEECEKTRSLQSDLDSKVEQIKNLTQNLEHLTIERDELQKRNIELTESQTTNLATIEELVEFNELNEYYLAEAAAENYSKYAEIESLYKYYAELIDENTKQVDALKAELSANKLEFEEKLKAAQTILDEKQLYIEKQLKTIEYLELDLDNSQKYLGVTRSDLQEKSDQLDKFMKQCQSSESSSAQAALALAEKYDQIKNLKQKIQETNEKYDQISMKSQAMKQYILEAQYISVKLDQAKDEIKDLNMVQAKLKAEIEDLYNYIRDRDAKQQASIQTIKYLYNEITNLTSYLDAEKLLNARQLTQLNANRKEIDEYNDKALEYANKLYQETDKRKEAEKYQQYIYKQLKLEQDKTSYQKDAIEKLEYAKAKLGMQHSDGYAEINELNDKLNMYKIENDAEIEKIKAENEQEINRYMQKQYYTERYLTETKQRLDYCSAELMAYRQYNYFDKGDADDQITTLNKYMYELQDNIKQNELNYLKMQTENVYLKSNVDSLTTRLYQLNDKYTALNKSYNELLTNIYVKQYEIDYYVVKIYQLEQTVLYLNQQVEYLKVKINSLTITGEENADQIITLNKDIYSLRDSDAAHYKHIKDLNTKIQDLNAKSALLNENIDEKDDELQYKVIRIQELDYAQEENYRKYRQLYRQLNDCYEQLETLQSQKVQVDRFLDASNEQIKYKLAKQRVLIYYILSMRSEAYDLKSAIKKVKYIVTEPTISEIHTQLTGTSQRNVGILNEQQVRVQYIENTHARLQQELSSTRDRLQYTQTYLSQQYTECNTKQYQIDLLSDLAKQTELLRKSVESLTDDKSALGEKLKLSQNYLKENIRYQKTKESELTEIKQLLSQTKTELEKTTDDLSRQKQLADDRKRQNGELRVNIQYLEGKRGDLYEQIRHDLQAVHSTQLSRMEGEVKYIYQEKHEVLKQNEALRHQHEKELKLVQQNVKNGLIAVQKLEKYLHEATTDTIELQEKLEIRQLRITILEQEAAQKRMQPVSVGLNSADELRDANRTIQQLRQELADLRLYMDQIRQYYAGYYQVVIYQPRYVSSHTIYQSQPNRKPEPHHISAMESQLYTKLIIDGPIVYLLQGVFEDYPIPGVLQDLARQRLRFLMVKAFERGSPKQYALLFILLLKGLIFEDNESDVGVFVSGFGEEELGVLNQRLGSSLRLGEVASVGRLVVRGK